MVLTFPGATQRFSVSRQTVLGGGRLTKTAARTGVAAGASGRPFHGTIGIVHPSPTSFVLALVLIAGASCAAHAASDYDAFIAQGNALLQAGNADQALNSGEAAIKLRADRWEGHALRRCNSTANWQPTRIFCVIWDSGLPHRGIRTENMIWYSKGSQ